MSDRRAAPKVLADHPFPSLAFPSYPAVGNMSGATVHGSVPAGGAVARSGSHDVALRKAAIERTAATSPALVDG